MMSRPSLRTQRRYGVSFSAANFLASSSETMASLAMIAPLWGMMRMIVMMNALGRPADTRILAEQQRLDRHRHRVGWHAHAPEIDIIEVSELNPVDCQDLALDE